MGRRWCGKRLILRNKLNIVELGMGTIIIKDSFLITRMLLFPAGNACPT